MISRSKQLGILSVLVLILLGIFSHLIASDPLLARDDQNILSHLHGFMALVDLWKNHRLSEVIAYQPIRDATYFWDLSVQKYLGVSTFHFTNFAIWIAVIGCVFSLLKTLYPDRILVLEMTVLFALNPIFVDSVGWISARKHLLSCWFIFMATRLVIGFQKNRQRKWSVGLLIFFLYCFSILSQPINVLWPIWLLVYYFCLTKKERRPGLLLILFLCLPVLIIGGIANLYYYFHLYPYHTATLRWTPSDGSGGIPFLALGRYIFNFYLPVKLALVYYPGSLPNILGLGFGLLLITALIWKKGFRSVLPWLVFFLFPLIPVIAKPTNIFVSDTYILVASFGLLNFLILAVGSIWKKSPIIYAILVATFIVLSFRQAKNWESDRALWTSSYASEATPKSLAFHAKYLLEDGSYVESTREAILLESWDVKEEEFPLLFAKSIYLNPEFSDDRKISLLESRKKTAPWIDYYLASLYAREGKFSEACQLMTPALESSAVFSNDLPIVTAETTYFCAKEKSSVDGLTRVLSELRKTKYWDEQHYQARLSELSRHE